jgi:hypothetical protein
MRKLLGYTFYLFGVACETNYFWSIVAMTKSLNGTMLQREFLFVNKSTNGKLITRFIYLVLLVKQITSEA